MTEKHFHPVAVENQREKPAGEMMKTELGALTQAARGPMGRWLLGAALLLTSEGCAGMRGAVRDYRSNVATTYFAGRMPVPSANPEANVSPALLNTSEGRNRSARVSPPLPEGALSTDSAGATMFGGTLTFRERTTSGRLREAQMGSPELLRSGDRLLIRDERGNEWLDANHLEGRWWREMSPGRIYQGTDGREYLLLAYQRVALPSAHDPRPAVRPSTQPNAVIQPSPTPIRVSHQSEIPLSERARTELVHSAMQSPITYTQYEATHQANPVLNQEARNRRMDRQNFFRPQPQTPMAADPGIPALQQGLEAQFGAELDLQIYHRQEVDPLPQTPIRTGTTHEILGTASAGHQEWRSPAVYYLVRTRNPQEPSSAQP